MMKIIHLVKIAAPTIISDGNINIPIVSPAVKIPLPILNISTKKANLTIVGTPTRFDILSYIKSFNFPFFIYSSKYIALPIPTGSSITIVTNTTLKLPTSNVKLLLFYFFIS